MGGFSLGFFLSHKFTETSRNPETRHSIFSEVADSDVDVNRLISARSLKQSSDASHFGSFFARTKAILTYVKNADIDVVQRLWRESKKLEFPKFQEEIQNRVFQRWAVLNPRTALSTATDELPTRRQSAAIELIYREWSLSNLQDAITYAEDLIVEHRESALAGIVFAGKDLSPKQLREIARRLDRESFVIDLLKKTTNEVVIEAPEQEWNVFVSANLNRFQHLSEEDIRMLAEIGHSWVLRDGVAVFEEMQEALPENTRLLSTVTAVSDQLMSTHPQLALDFVLKGVDHEQELGYHELAVKLITRWAQTEPNQALEATKSIKAYSMRRQAHRRVFEQWSEPDPYVLLDSLTMLPEDLQNLAQESALSALAKHSPERVTGMLGDLSVRGHRDRVAKAIVSSWATLDLTSTLEWIANEPLVAHRQGTLKELAFKTLASTDPQLALEIALQQPLKANGEGWEGDVIHEVILRDMDAAVTMLPHARPGETRHDSYDFAVMVSLFDSDFDSATDLFLNLTEVESKVPLSIDLFARLAPERLFESLGVIGSVEARTASARNLLEHYEGKEVFSEAQIDLIREVERSQSQKLNRRMSDRLRKAFIELRDALEEEGSQ